MHLLKLLPGVIALALVAAPARAGDAPQVESMPVDATRLAGPAPDTIPQATTQTEDTLGATVPMVSLEELRGGQSTVTNEVLIDGTVNNNTADHIISGNNSISDDAFSNSAGLNTVIQNTGSNVLIQNGMVVNIQFGAGSVGAGGP